VCDNRQDLIGAQDTDAIVIDTWPYLHCLATLSALEADKHVPELIPEFELSTGFFLRAYQSGDEEAWAAIQSVADIHNKIAHTLRTTSTARSPAINLYLKLVFVPVSENVEEFVDDNHQ
jgi:hypothetical protein